MIPAIIAAIAMVIQDVLGTIMVMAEAKNRGWLAGVMDSAGWIVSITTATIAITAFQGHNMNEKVLVVILVSLANLFGTKLGQMIGSRYVKDATTLADRVARLESQSTTIHH